MKISILNPNLSCNGLGRSYLLAKILQRSFEVEIVGPQMGTEIWRPVFADKEITYEAVCPSSRFQKYTKFQEVYSRISGDVIYADGPLLMSYGVGLLHAALTKKPLVLDIDDWQLGFRKAAMAEMSTMEKLSYLCRSALTWYRESSYWNIYLFEKLVPLADQLTVANTFLKHAFGGSIIYHARDTEAFNPEKYDKNQYRYSYGIDSSSKVVMFFGTPRRHKGIEDLIEAISLVEDNRVMLVLVGIDDKDPYAAEIKAQAETVLANRFKGFGMQPFDRIPEFLSMADVVAIPQRYSTSSVGQTPAKVFDAMSMAKPVIATDVGDMRDILKGCGWVVEPQQPALLARSILEAIGDPEHAESMGNRARRKCIERYSWNAMEPLLNGIFEKYR